MNAEPPLDDDDPLVAPIIFFIFFVNFFTLDTKLDVCFLRASTGGATDETAPSPSRGGSLVRERVSAPSRSRPGDSCVVSSRSRRLKLPPCTLAANLAPSPLASVPAGFDASAGDAGHSERLFGTLENAFSPFLWMSLLDTALEPAAAISCRERRCSSKVAPHRRRSMVRVTASVTACVLATYAHPVS